MTATQISCSLCGEVPESVYTQLCDNCWELTNRIQHKPELARKVLRNMETHQQTHKHLHNALDELLADFIGHTMKMYLSIMLMVAMRLPFFWVYKATQ